MKRLDSSDEKMGNYHEHMQSVFFSDHKLGIVFWNAGKFTDILNCLYHNPPVFAGL